MGQHPGQRDRRLPRRRRESRGRSPTTGPARWSASGCTPRAGRRTCLRSRRPVGAVVAGPGGTPDGARAGPRGRGRLGPPTRGAGRSCRASGSCRPAGRSCTCSSGWCRPGARGVGTNGRSGRRRGRGRLVRGVRRRGLPEGAPPDSPRESRRAWPPGALGPDAPIAPPWRFGIPAAGRGVGRVGPVFTAPAARGHGYAAAVTAAATRAVLALGGEAMLFTEPRTRPRTVCTAGSATATRGDSPPGGAVSLRLPRGRTGAGVGRLHHFAVSHDVTRG